MNQIKSKFDELCMPDPIFFPDKLERHHQFERNRTFLVMIFIMTIILSLDLVSEDEPLSLTHYCFAVLYPIIIFTYYWTRHLNPKIFKIFYAFSLSVIGPLCVYLDEDGVFGGWGMVHFSPLFLLVFSDSHLLYFLQVGIQIFLLEVLYKDEMIKSMHNRMPSMYVQEVTSITTYTVLAQSLIIYKLNKMLEKNFKHELAHEEKKRKDLEVQKTFILSFSHEIRNLINTLIGNIQVSLLGKLAPKVKSCLEDAEIGASLLIQLINNILDSGSLDVGELEMNPATRVMQNTLEKMWTMCAHVLKAKNLKGQLRVSKELPKYLKIDHDRLMQILINLFTNAVKFTEQGTVDIKVEWIKNTTTINDKTFFPVPFDDENEGVFEKNLAFTVLRNEFTILGVDKKRWSSNGSNTIHDSGPGILKFTVIDTGYGVLSENLPYVFYRFSYQLFGDNSSSNRLGTTIGLYVTKQLCNRMRGDIRVFSKVNKGTTFIVCLPAEQIPEHSTPKNMIPSQKQKLRAMIVDDLSFNIVVLTNYLQRMQIDIADTAADGGEAYDKYVQSIRSCNPIDIVTMDVEMPVMNGKQTAQKIREYERQNSLKPCFLIMISGNVCESEISQCLRHEGKELANHFLKKPATFDDVFRVISEYFQLQKSIITWNSS